MVVLGLRVLRSRMFLILWICLEVLEALVLRLHLLLFLVVDRRRHWMISLDELQSQLFHKCNLTVFSQFICSDTQPLWWRIQRTILQCHYNQPEPDQERCPFKLLSATTLFPPHFRMSTC